MSDGDSCGFVAEPGGNFGPRHLTDICEPFELNFTSGQARVSAFVRLQRGGSGSTTAVSVTAYDAPTPSSRAPSVTNATEWTPLTLTTDAATIRRVLYFDAWSRLDVDDIGFSSVAQPDADITDGPSGTVNSATATFSFAGNQDRLQYFCKLDGAASAPCSSPASLLRPGRRGAHVPGDRARPLGHHRHDPGRARLDRRERALRPRRRRHHRRRRQLPGPRQRRPGRRGQGRRRRRL